MKLAVNRTGSGLVNLVLLHGWMMDGGSVFSSMTPKLKSMTVHSVDLRGTGRSEKPPAGYALEDYVSDVAETFDSFDTFVLCGHSMGGQIAQLFAARYPEKVKGLFLMNSVPMSGIQLPDEVTQLFRNCAGSKEMQSGILDAACLTLSTDEKERLLASSINLSPACVQESFDAWTQGGFESELKKITAPTMVFGTSDPFLPPELLQSAIVDKIENAVFHQLLGPGHYPQCENPTETAFVLNRFVAGLIEE